MAHYQAMGSIPPKRHTQHRVPAQGRTPRQGDLYYEELMGEEGFSSDSSLLYHRYIPSTISGAREWVVGDMTTTPNQPLLPRHLRLHDLDEVTLHLPFAVADYVDFYASEHHASNVGRIFRPDSEPLTPNWKHLPIGYHGRSGTVVVSGTDIVRPSGQRRPPSADAPTFGPSRRPLPGRCRGA